VAKHRHKRDTNARRTLRIARVAAPAAVLMTVSAVGLGVLNTDAPNGQDLLAGADRNDSKPPVAAALSQVGPAMERGVPVSRSKNRATQKAEPVNPFARDSKATLKAIRTADTRLWATADLNLWDAPGEEATQVGLISSGSKLLATGREEGERAEIVQDEKTFWVTAQYLADEKPDPGPNLGGACTNGTSVASGVSASIVAVHEAVCANWPQISTYGTLRSDGEHAQGRAVDIMISGPVGWEVAEFLRENYSALGIEYIIYEQKIWSVERSAEGWRGMSNRGSVTANHYDHVHVTVY
jgi:hypothetical protein